MKKNKNILLVLTIAILFIMAGQAKAQCPAGQSPGFGGVGCIPNIGASGPVKSGGTAPGRGASTAPTASPSANAMREATTIVENATSGEAARVEQSGYSINELMFADLWQAVLKVHEEALNMDMNQGHLLYGDKIAAIYKVFDDAYFAARGDQLDQLIGNVKEKAILTIAGLKDLEAEMMQSTPPQTTPQTTPPTSPAGQCPDTLRSCGQGCVPKNAACQGNGYCLEPARTSCYECPQDQVFCGMFCYPAGSKCCFGGKCSAGGANQSSQPSSGAAGAQGQNQSGQAGQPAGGPGTKQPAGQGAKAQQPGQPAASQSAGSKSNAGQNNSGSKSAGQTNPANNSDLLSLDDSAKLSETAASDQHRQEIAAMKAYYEEHAFPQKLFRPGGQIEAQNEFDKTRPLGIDVMNAKNDYENAINKGAADTEIKKLEDSYNTKLQDLKDKLQNVLKLDSGNPSALWQSGTLSKWEGDNKQAYEDYREALTAEYLRNKIEYTRMLDAVKGFAMKMALAQDVAKAVQELGGKPDEATMALPTTETSPFLKELRNNLATLVQPLSGAIKTLAENVEKISRAFSFSDKLDKAAKELNITQ